MQGAARGGRTLEAMGSLGHHRHSLDRLASTSYEADFSGDLRSRGKGHPSGFFSALRRGIDLQGAGENHKFTAEERQRLCMVESIDYLPPDSVVYRKWLARQPHRRAWDRWFMMGSIGMTVGLAGYLLDLIIQMCAAAKWYTVR